MTRVASQVCNIPRILLVEVGGGEMNVKRRGCGRERIEGEVTGLEGRTY